ncbi:MAG: hypothetical protein II336_05620 [Loktanella sp.]|nr:hypothetical protein [Loktanella sp.]
MNELQSTLDQLSKHDLKSQVTGFRHEAAGPTMEMRELVEHIKSLKKQIALREQQE